MIDHYPSFSFKDSNHTNTLSIKHVLSQSTGLPYQAYSTMIEDGVDLETMIEELQNLDLIGAPGEHYSYQNVGYSLIEKVIQESTGSTYKTLLEDKIFSPLEMNNASSSYEDIITSDI